MKIWIFLNISLNLLVLLELRFSVFVEANEWLEHNKECYKLTECQPEMALEVKLVYSRLHTPSFRNMEEYKYECYGNYDDHNKQGKVKQHRLFMVWVDEVNEKYHEYIKQCY